MYDIAVHVRSMNLLQVNFKQGLDLRLKSKYALSVCLLRATKDVRPFECPGQHRSCFNTKFLVLILTTPVF